MPRGKLNIGRSQDDAKRMHVVRRERQSNNDNVVNDRGSWSRKDYSAMNYELTVD